MSASITVHHKKMVFTGLTCLALIGSSVTVETEIDSSISLILVSKGNAGSEGNLEPRGTSRTMFFISRLHLSPYDSIASIEVLGIHVH